MTTNPLKDLAAAELIAAASPIQSALSAIAASDGSTAAVVGNGGALLGHLVAIAPTLQKVGVVGLANYFNLLISNFVAAHAATTTAPVTSGQASA